MTIHSRITTLSIVLVLLLISLPAWGGVDLEQATGLGQVGDVSWPGAMVLAAYMLSKWKPQVLIRVKQEGGDDH